MVALTQTGSRAWMNDKMNRQNWQEFSRFTVKVIIVHILTYFVVGALMSNVLDYRELFQREIIRDFLLPLDSHALLGVIFQPVRGLLFAIALWPIRKAILEKNHGFFLPACSLGYYRLRSWR
jgi:hypothetical protein